MELELAECKIRSYWRSFLTLWACSVSLADISFYLVRCLRVYELQCSLKVFGGFWGFGNLLIFLDAFWLLYRETLFGHMFFKKAWRVWKGPTCELVVKLDRQKWRLRSACSCDKVYFLTFWKVHKPRTPWPQNYLFAYWVYMFMTFCRLLIFFKIHFFIKFFRQ